MCDVAFIGPALKIVGEIQNHRAANARADAQEDANEARRRNADYAYLKNIENIGKDKSLVEAEQQNKEMAIEREARQKYHSGLAAGFGDPMAIVRKILPEYSLQTGGVQTAAAMDIIKLSNQQDMAYSELKQDYLSLPGVERPDMFNTGLAIAGHAADGYAASENS